MKLQLKDESVQILGFCGLFLALGAILGPHIPKTTIGLPVNLIVISIALLGGKLFSRYGIITKIALCTLTFGIGILIGPSISKLLLQWPYAIALAAICLLLGNLIKNNNSK